MPYVYQQAGLRAYECSCFSDGAFPYRYSGFETIKLIYRCGGSVGLAWIIQSHRLPDYPLS